MKIIVDNKIPFIEGKLEPFGEVVYLPSDKIDSKTVEDADVLVIRTRTKCDKKLLENSKVKLIVTATIGTDHIDLPWCEGRGIEVRNAPGCNAPAVAQYVWASLLHNGFKPEGSVIGVVGYGHIGQIVARWGKEMGCKVMICDPPRYKSGLRDVEYRALDDLLTEADVITVHTPLSFTGEDATFGMIGERELDKMKPGAWIINAARGGIVVEKELLEVMKRKDLKSVTDCWENEPNINLKLLEKAVVATPHIAGYSLEGKRRATEMAVETVKKWVANKDGKETRAIDCETVVMKCSVSPRKIKESYNPSSDTENLRLNPGNFEKLRETYNYRHEVLCDI